MDMRWEREGEDGGERHMGSHYNEGDNKGLIHILLLTLQSTATYLY